MIVESASSAVIHARQEALKKILARHPHACLTCAQREGCDRVQCSMNVPALERCCELLRRCEIGKISDYIGIPTDTPPYRNESRPAITGEPLFIRDYELCINCLRCVRVCHDVRGVDAFGAVMTSDGVKVGTLGGPTLVDALCRFCGACVAVCPTGTLRDKEGCVPLVDGLAPCVAACPLHINVPGYLDLITRGLEYEALELIRERAVLPGVLGYACFHPCEDACRRGRLDDSASICALKRYLSDAAGEKPARLDKVPPTGKRVAVIGSGPAGLAAAAELLRAGHSVTMFEQDDQIGGMLVQAIPGFRLPDEVVERDLKYLYGLGLETRTNSALGKDITTEKLLADGYNAVVIAVGLSEPARLGVTGEDMVGVELGLDFLRRARAGEAGRLDGSVVVIGGGSVAVDAAMSARRLGAARVRMVCLENEEEIPAAKDELKAAVEEGVEIRHRWGVERINCEYGRAKSVTLKRCTRVFDSQRRFAPEYDSSETVELPCDHLIIAIGQRVKPELKPYLTPQPGLFIAGDAQSGASSIVAAMADGVKAAGEVDSYLRSSKVPKFQSSKVSEFSPPVSGGESKGGYLGRDPAFFQRRRLEPDTIAPEERVKSGAIYQATLTRDQAMEEAARCLRCHLRASLAPAPLPPDPWQKFDRQLLEVVPSMEGVLILADEKRQTVKIAGAVDIHIELERMLGDGVKANFCRWELDPMFTKRESELLQAHLSAYGKMPEGGELDELF
jgi:NADPH-dependent glutamate synthase beta subunit-like oxidoreductase/Pyruvate/2-oxoacid:ferredoxin oxidoreductase delta subunit